MKPHFIVTPENIRKLILWQYNIVEHIDACLRLKRSSDATEAAEFAHALSEQELIALVQGANTVLDKILLQHHCYNGYDTLGDRKTFRSKKKLEHHRFFVGKDHPEFAAWRRKYRTRDIVMD